MSEITNEVKVVPVYEFAPEQENVEPIKRKIRKTMEVTEEFSAWDVLQYMANMDKQINTKQAELDGLKNMKEQFLKEMVHVEEQTGVTALQEEYQEKVANDIGKEIPTDVSDEVSNGEKDV